jgi:hypothetical protein
MWLEDQDDLGETTILLDCCVESFCWLEPTREDGGPRKWSIRIPKDVWEKHRLIGVREQAAVENGKHAGAKEVCCATRSGRERMRDR